LKTLTGLRNNYLQSAHNLQLEEEEPIYMAHDMEEFAHTGMHQLS
jgi:hypothetical protein